MEMKKAFQVILCLLSSLLDLGLLAKQPRGPDMNGNDHHHHQCCYHYSPSSLSYIDNILQPHYDQTLKMNARLRNERAQPCSRHCHPPPSTAWLSSCLRREDGNFCVMRRSSKINQNSPRFGGVQSSSEANVSPCSPVSCGPTRSSSSGKYVVHHQPQRDDYMLRFIAHLVEQRSLNFLFNFLHSYLGFCTELSHPFSPGIAHTRHTRHLLPAHPKVAIMMMTIVVARIQSLYCRLQTWSAR